MLQLQLPAQAANLLRSPAADPALQYSISAPSPHQHQHHLMRSQPTPVQTSVQTATVPTPLKGTADSIHHASTGTRTAASAASAARSSVIGHGARGATLPCPLSSFWLTQPDAAATTAAAILKAAGVQRTPSEVLTCSILQQLRHAQYAAATETIAARARQLYEPGGDMTSGAAAAADSAGQPAAVHSQSTVGPLKTARPADAQAISAAAVQQGALQPLPSPLSPASGAASAVEQQQVPAQHSIPSRAAQQQQQQQKPRWWARQRHSKQPAAGRQHHQPAGPTTPAAGAKRKGRGWRVVSMGDGRTATVACSSSDDSGG